MKVQMNRKMKFLLKVKPSELQSVKIELPHALRQALAGIDFIERDGLVTFEGGFKPGCGTKGDPTDLECLLNKVQMDEYVSGRPPSLLMLTRIGISYALAVKEKLEKARFSGDFRIIVSAARSLDDSVPYTCTFRFHRLRKGAPWLNDEIESYENEALLTIDWTNAKNM